MRTIGLLGGMSWESTAYYYRLLNEGIKKALGKQTLESVDDDQTTETLTRIILKGLGIIPGKP